MSVATRSGLGRRVAANTLHAASGRMASLAVWIVFAPAILRSLGADVFAVWAMFFAVTGHFAALDFGLVQGTLRHVAAARECDDHARAGAFASLAVLGFFVLALLWLAVTLAGQGALIAWLRIPDERVDVARFALLAAPAVFLVSGIANVLVAVAQGYGRFDVANRVVLVLTAQQAIGIPIVLHNGWGLRGLVVNLGLGWLTGILLGLATSGRSAPGFRWRGVRAARAHLPEAVRFGGPMQITSVLSVVNLHLDKFLLSRFVALAAVTPYEFGARVASTAMTFPQLMLLAILPVAAELHAADEPGRVRELYVRGNHYVLAGTAIVVAALMATADRLFEAWLGPGMLDAALVLRGLAVALGAAMTAGMASTVARGIGRTDLETWFHVVALGIHLGLSLWLLPILGLRGAVVAFAVGNVAGAIVLLVLLAGVQGWSRFSTAFAPNAIPIAAALAGAAVGWGVHQALPSLQGFAAWGAFALVGSCAVLAALALLVLSRYVSYAEFMRLVRGDRASLSPG
jgi:O-antigen/teichoic acid export membrane protein